MSTVCLEPGCDDEVLAKDRCSACYQRHRRETDPAYRMRNLVSTRMRHYLKSTAGSKEMLGCSWDEFAERIESRFAPGMSWSNQTKDGGWVLALECDVRAFEDMRDAFHYSHWRPRWSDINMNPPETCTIYGCDRPYLASGLCKYHYDLKQQNGVPKPWREAFGAVHCEHVCRICGEPFYAKDLCESHYKHDKKWGHPTLRPFERFGGLHASPICLSPDCDEEVHLSLMRPRADYCRNCARRRRYQNDIEYKLRRLLISRVKYALASGSAREELRQWLGCTIPELMNHIETQFQPGMDWDNYGQWHLDHIIPLAHFDLTHEEGRRRALHWTNLQPLWSDENHRKHARLLFRESWESSIMYRAATKKEWLSS